MEAISKKTNALSLRSKAIGISILISTAIVAGLFSSFFSYVAFLLAAVAIVVLPEDDVLCILLFIMSFANIFKSSPTAQSFFTYLILLYVLWHIVQIRYINKAFILSFLFLMVYIMVQMIASVNLLRTIKFASNILFIYFALESSDTSKNSKLFLCYILGVVLSSSIAVLNIIPNLDDYINTKDTWLQMEQFVRFSGMYPDPNYYSVNLIISLCLVVLLNHNKELSAVQSIVIAALLILFAGLTLSKSVFIMLILPLALLLHSRIKRKNYFVLLCTTIAVMIILPQLFSGRIAIFNATLYRISGATDIDTLTTGRSDLWQNYITYLSEHTAVLFFGRGFGAELVGSRAAHNTYFDLLYHLGICGTASLAIVFYTLIIIDKNPGKLSLTNHSIWITIAVMYFFLSELFYFDWAFHVLIAIMVSRINLSSVQRGIECEEICI